MVCHATFGANVSQLGANICICFFYDKFMTACLFCDGKLHKRLWAINAWFFKKKKKIEEEESKWNTLPLYLIKDKNMVWIRNRENKKIRENEKMRKNERKWEKMREWENREWKRSEERGKGRGGGRERGEEEGEERVSIRGRPQSRGTWMSYRTIVVLAIQSCPNHRILKLQ
jgi:hypothetical protein